MPGPTSLIKQGGMTVNSISSTYISTKPGKDCDDNH